MKKLLSILILLSISTSTFAQDSHDELIRKSRRARTTSTILVATGPVIAAGGIGILIYGLADKVGYIDYYDVNGNYVRNTKNHNNEIIIGSAVTLVGIAAALYSIHFSKKASDLKREARKAKLKATTDRISIPGLQNGFANNRARQCKLSLIVPLGR
ncbi:MAG: hypothetical protein IPO01_17920 [Chitinophagaceae bacterium]|nr:hypothetical protein [Chitinophagaceae bacterium]MBK9486983.1 hypothetical protein [Chitinophagaceae bacterium]MBL0199711.1 hypothetical protein [Chitinophagaceae bacterium]